MATTYEKIASVTVGSGGAANIEFTSIPGTFDDLVVKISGRSDRNALTDDMVYQFNNDSTPGRYSYRALQGNGANATSAAAGSAAFDYLGIINAATSTSSTFSSFDVYIPNYKGSTQKSSSVDQVHENNATTAYVSFIANLYNQTTAITSIKFYSVNGNNFVQHSTATLYGIKKS